ncbi:MAG: chemotaxis protein CheW, partial [Desulfobulbaceae bacterium]|nr:chemotaxis protein CheW [Desulfobulbaceae bacterium]
KEGGSLTIGSLADAVKEVIEIAPDQIEPPPDMGTHWKKDYIIGVGQYNDEFIMLLDIKKLFSMSELTTLDQAGAGQGALSSAETTCTT